MAVAKSTTAPQARSQPSRKGKRAWRKNVDITEVQSGLEEARNEIAQTGGKLLADVSAEDLFALDTAGSVTIKNQVRKAHPQLKADEIIAQRSAVPAVNSRKRAGTEDVRVTDGVIEPSSKRRRANGVSHKELQRLKQIAYGESSLKDVVTTDGTATHDPWAIVAPEPIKPTENYLPPPAFYREPKTLKHAPVSLTASGKSLPHVRKPIGGSSYNPAFNDWTTLVAKEGEKELAAEVKRRAAAAAEAEKQARIAATLAEAEREEQREAALSEYDESEWEGCQSEVDEAQLKRKRPERKTPVERNKINRRKEAERLAKHERKIKERDEQLKRIAAIAKSMRPVAKFPGSVESDGSDEGVEEEQGETLRRRRLGRIHIPEAPLEVVLADELQDSLRRLRPEGNLLKERFRNLLVQGKVEARKPIQQAKTKKGKVTEKWSSKDFDLGNYR